MSDGYQDPLSPNANFSDDHNPYAAPAEAGEVAISVDSELATLSARFTGAFVDGLLMLPAIGAIVFVAVNMAMSGVFAEDDITSEFFAGVAGAVIAAVWYLLLNGYFLSTRGQTIGKIAAGTRIVDAHTGEILPLMRLFIKRYGYVQLLGLIPVVGNFIGLVDVLMIFRDNRRCLHDDFAGTKVIAVK